MYKIVGADGKEYGPVTLDQLKQWVAEGRLNPRSRLQGPDAGWKSASEFPEVADIFAAQAAGAGAAAPPISMPAAAQRQENGLATTSLVCGILSIVLSIFCAGLLPGIPAIICGHIARSRARRGPARYGGASPALAGLIMGYLSVVLTLVVLPAMLLPALAKAKDRAQRIACANNLHQIGNAMRMWALDHGDQYPFNLSTNKGGTLELIWRGADGFDQNSVVHFQVLSNELGSPKVLCCPADSSKTAALSWPTLQTTHVSYLLHSGDPEEVLAICPIHGNALQCDGGVIQVLRYRNYRPAGQ